MIRVKTDKKTEKTKNIILLYDKGCSIGEIASTLNTSYHSVALRLNRNGLRLNHKRKSPRKTLLNENFFNYINSDDKAYFFGLLCADGSVNSKINSVRISLQDRDRYIIESFKKCVESSTEIKLNKFPSGGTILGVPVKQRRLHYLFQVYSPIMVSDLIRHGCMERKTLHFRMPKNIPNEFIGGFLRGYFDGDGWATVYEKKKRISIGFTGTKTFIGELAEYLILIGIKPSLVNDKRNPNCASLVVQNRAGIIKLRELFYGSNPSYFLIRKKEKIFNYAW